MEIYKKYKIIKYSDIKLAKGLCLDSVKDIERHGFGTGMSSKRYGTKWQMLPKGRAVFKTYDGEGVYKKIKEVRIVNELLCYELSKQVGILCAEYELANKDGITGLVSYEIKTDKNQELISAVAMFQRLNICCRNNFDSYIEAIRRFRQQGYKIDAKKVLCDLYKVTLFDALTLQTDRHSGNIFMIMDYKKKTIKVAPILDNELAFASGICYESLDSDCYIYPESIKNYTFMIQKFIEIKNDPMVADKFKANIKNLAGLAKQNKTFEKIFKDMIFNYNIQTAIDKLSGKGVEINDKYKQFLVESQNITKKMLIEEYNLQTVYPSNKHSFNLDMQK